MSVLCLAGAWCGDCVNQCPIFDHFERLNPRISVRYFDRDTHADLARELKVCGGARVPVVVFLSEDGFEVGRFGDRTLAKYRKLAADQFGPSCPTGLVPEDRSLVDAVDARMARYFRAGAVDPADFVPVAAKARRLRASHATQCLSRLTQALDA